MRSKKYGRKECWYYWSKSPKQDQHSAMVQTLIRNSYSVSLKQTGTKGLNYTAKITQDKHTREPCHCSGDNHTTTHRLVSVKFAPYFIF